MLYIDFDGVILDTEELLFREWRKRENHKSLPESEKIKYIKARDWNEVIYKSPIINDSIYYLNNTDPKRSTVLTRVHSLENEAATKIKWLREQKVKQNIIVVPHTVKKCDMVDPKNNILVDDALFNLDEWVELGGIPILFDYNDDGYDSWERPNIHNYQKVMRLGDIHKN
jgi:hypothetical protein